RENTSVDVDEIRPVGIFRTGVKNYQLRCGPAADLSKAALIACTWNQSARYVICTVALGPSFVDGVDNKVGACQRRERKRFCHLRNDDCRTEQAPVTFSSSFGRSK